MRKERRLFGNDFNRFCVEHLQAIFHRLSFKMRLKLIHPILAWNLEAEGGSAESMKQSIHLQIFWKRNVKIIWEIKDNSSQMRNCFLLKRIGITHFQIGIHCNLSARDEGQLRIIRVKFKFYSKIDQCIEPILV